jgi:hypothetical protein
MSAAIIPFPLGRRRALVRKQARLFAATEHRAAERNLAHQLELQRQVMRRRGIDERSATAEVAALEGAIRAEVRRLVFTSGGGAA